MSEGQGVEGAGPSTSRVGKDLLEGLRVGLPDSFEDREADLVGVCDGFEDRGVDLVGLCDSVEDREVGRVKKLRSFETLVKIEGWKDM